MKAILWFSFGGPETPDDIWPFLERVTAGRGVPRERLALVRDQYLATGGFSPLNRQNREIISRLSELLVERGLDLPIYFGNRNSAPFLGDTVEGMADDGVTDALVITTSAFGSYSGCRQYQDDLARARPAFRYTKLPPWATDPRGLSCFIEVLDNFVDSHPSLDWTTTRLIVTAHSIPLSMAATAPYEKQLDEVRAILQEHLAKRIGIDVPTLLGYQSRSGNPRTPWLEPDVGDMIAGLAHDGVLQVAVFPIGFISDHQEVLYDLDILARKCADDTGVEMFRLPTVSQSTRFAPLMADYVQEWLAGRPFTTNTCFQKCCALPDHPTFH